MIVAGFGFRSAASADSLAQALDFAASGRTVDALATAADKAPSPAFQSLGQRTGLPTLGLSEADLRGQTTLTQSPASLAARGIGSLAEAAALAAAGPGARLLGPRALSEDGQATCALAQGDTP